MTSREKNLALGVGMLAPLILGYFAWSWYTGARTERMAKLQTATKQLELLQAKQRYANAEVALREEWKRDSLPDNREMGLNQFQLWLGSIANKHQLSSLDVVGQYVGETRDVAKKFKFSMDAYGSIDQLAKFLEDFARVDRLQAIRNLTIEPDKSGKLKINMTAEALALVGNKNTTLPAETRTSLSPDAAKGLASRNFFAEYVPPPPPRKEEPRVAAPPPPPPPPAFDFGKLTFVTAVIENNGEPEVWLYHRAQEKTEHLRAGDSFDLGEQRGKVVSIDVLSQAVDLEIGNRKKRVVNGNSLAANSTAGGPGSGASEGNSGRGPGEGGSGRGFGEGNSGRGFGDGNTSGRPSGSGFGGFGKGGSGSSRDSRGSSDKGGDSRSRFRPPSGGSPSGNGPGGSSPGGN